jgi:hypothetical protein
MYLSAERIAVANQAVQKTFERRDAWIGSLRRGEPLTGKPDGPAQGM